MVLLQAGLACVPPSEDWISVLLTCPGIECLQFPPLAHGFQEISTAPPHLNARLLSAVPLPLGLAAAFGAACSQGRTKSRPWAPNSNQAAPCIPRPDLSQLP